MSNKIVPGVYRAIIDEVISAIRPAFDEFDITPDVLQELQHKWETKILASRVADFGSSAHSSTPSPSPTPLPGRISKNAAPVLRAPLYPALALPGPSLPPLPGPSLPLLPRPQLQYSHTTQQRPFNPDAHAGYALPTSYPFGGNGLQQQNQNQQSQNPTRAPYDDSAIFDPFSTAPLQQQQQMYRLPQTDGPSGSLYSDEEEEDELEGEGEQGAKAAPPRAAHPSVARPKAASSALTSTHPTSPTDDSGLTSDLDDTDSGSSSPSSLSGGSAGLEADLLFCTYEKVTRTKNKWRCVLRDGVVHAGGRDWLFGRCTGEFEW